MLVAKQNVDGAAKYIFYDPNFGIAQFKTASDLKQALQDQFVTRRFSSMYSSYGDYWHPRFAVREISPDNMARFEVRPGYTVDDMVSPARRPGGIDSPVAIRPTVPADLPPTARKIGYHGTTGAGFESIQSNGVQPSTALRTGKTIDNRSPLFYLTDRWENARSYADSDAHVFEIWATDPSMLTTDAFRKNAQGVNELKIRGGFDGLIAVPASTTKHLPVSFNKLGFSEPHTPQHDVLPSVA